MKEKKERFIEIKSKMEKLFVANKKLHQIVMTKIRTNKEKVQNVVLHSSILTELELNNLGIIKDINKVDELIEKYVGTFLNLDFYVSNASDFKQVEVNYKLSSLELSEIERLKVDLDRVGEMNQDHLQQIKEFESLLNIEHKRSLESSSELSKKNKWIKNDLLRILFDQESQRQKQLFELMIRISNGDIFEEPKKQVEESNIPDFLFNE